jgi:hypothetical protein
MSTLTAALPNYGPVGTVETEPAEVCAPEAIDRDADECAPHGIMFALALAVPLWVGAFLAARQVYQLIAG